MSDKSRDEMSADAIALDLCGLVADDERALNGIAWDVATALDRLKARNPKFSTALALANANRHPAKPPR